MVSGIVSALVGSGVVDAPVRWNRPGNHPDRAQ
jgi:hypothetical protein